MRFLSLWFMIINNLYPPITETPTDFFSSGTQPSFAAKGLMSLNVQDVCGFDFGDATIRAIPSAWPSLRCLATNNKHMVHPKMTLHGLSDLLHRYSQLKALCIYVSLLADHVKAFRLGSFRTPQLEVLIWDIQWRNMMFLEWTLNNFRRPLSTFEVLSCSAKGWRP
jgi:hypothetical protein